MVNSQMPDKLGISTVFLDIGGVILSNGWGHESRRLAASRFGIDLMDLEDRHKLNFDVFEMGHLSLQDYLQRVVFYRSRDFTPAQFTDFIFSQSTECTETISFFREMKAKHNLKIVVVSNEARELNAFRIHEFDLWNLVDVFVSSCFVHLRKPDVAIFQLALDISQTPVSKILYVDDTPLFVEIAIALGMKGEVHRNFKTTQSRLASLGVM